MRLLVTNTRSAQVYPIIRHLRPHAEHIVASVRTTDRPGSWANCQAAYSRLVDRRYRVPPPDRDLSAGRIQPDNTAAEEAYIQAILKICATERIDTVFPSTDPWIYVFAKNRERFAERGILIPVPDYDTVLIPLDKYRTIQRAEEIGFPCPRTYLGAHDEDIVRATDELPPPWVIKPRFGSGSAGVAILDRRSDVLEQSRMIRARHGIPMIQEYVPGKEKQNFYVVIDRSGAPLSVLAPRIVRYSRRVIHSATAACVTTDPPAFTDQAVALLSHMGWWGGATVQTKIDARDGTPKLMEVNPRLGASLWLRTELGINEPLMCLQIARGEPVDPVPDYPRDVMLLRPIDDLIGLGFSLLDLATYRVRTGLLGRTPLDAANAPAGLRESLRSLWRQYRHAGQRRFQPHFRYALSDPMPSLLYTGGVLLAFGRALGGLGR